MSNERNGHRTALVLFAVAVTVAILVAFVTTLERLDNNRLDNNKRVDNGRSERIDKKVANTANSETAPGTTGLAKAHPPLDRAPGQPVLSQPVLGQPASGR